jgi:hypothetical protein
MAARDGYLGPMDALEKILADLKKDGLASKLLPVAGASLFLDAGSATCVGGSHCRDV